MLSINHIVASTSAYTRAKQKEIERPGSFPHSIWYSTAHRNVMTFVLLSIIKQHNKWCHICFQNILIYIWSTCHAMPCLIKATTSHFVFYSWCDNVMLHGHFNIHCQHNVVELLLFYFFNSWFARPIWWKSIFSWGEDALPIGFSVEENVHKAHYHSINMMRQRRIRVSLMCLHEKVEPIKYSSGSLRAVVNLFIMNAISWKLTSIITQQLKNILLLL